ncbi:aspartate--tRNA ligase [Candidatus Saccharibacteria bacterium]|nr:aspartate--tRNA ligase [Candidatus Saccharibacteria bacterium]MBQ3263531.1 aspartate--tRNA ligase [Candidatus Saccharibacteria bacterium]
MRVFTDKLNDFLGKEVMVEGWVNSRRDHGGLIFIDLRDNRGLIQLVITPDTAEAFKLAESVRDEYVLKATGKLRERAPELINPNIPTGKIELVVSELTLLNRSEPLPVNTHDDGPESSEELRLKYRFLDLRRPKMQKRLARRSEFYRFIRNYMYDHGFTEVTTPILANSSPEGARDFLVPSRLHPGKFYALPQAPQQFKQLLMVGGVEKYFQIAPCFRDEDPRADRLYGDFYQLDFEMSFVEDGETVRKEIQPLYEKLTTEFAGKKLVCRSDTAKKYIEKGETVPRIPYTVSMDTYGVDKPDLRYGMELIDLTDVFKDTDFKVFKTPCVKALCVKGAANLTRREIDEFTEKAKKLGAGGLAYILYTDGEEKSPILKFMTDSEIKAVRERTGAKPGDAVFFGADDREKVNKVLGQLRIAFADHFGLKKNDEVALTWIVDFPFYEWDDKNNKLDFGHNPFSMPKGGLAALESAKTNEDKLAIVADQYDMVMNGYEVASGAVRNYNPEIMYKVFNILGYNNEYVEARFGGMLNAFKFGAPPHAGCAPGLDRIFMILEDEDNIRDIVAFPKNGNGVDLMMNSPSEVDQIQLDEAHLAIIPDEDD